MIYVDLMMDNGELVRIECPDKFEDQLHDSLENWLSGITALRITVLKEA